MQYSPMRLVKRLLVLQRGNIKKIKGLKKENLRDNMTNAELVINMLGELATTEISKTENPQGFEESKIVARDGGNIAGNVLRDLEERTGRKVVSSKNSKNPRLLDENLKQQQVCIFQAKISYVAEHMILMSFHVLCARSDDIYMYLQLCVIYCWLLDICKGK